MPKLTLTIPFDCVVTFTFEYWDRSSITLSRWSIRLLALMPAACAWAIWPFSCAIWLASFATAPVVGSVSVLYCWRDLRLERAELPGHGVELSATAAPSPITACWAPWFPGLEASEFQSVKNWLSVVDRPSELGSFSPAWTWLRIVWVVFWPFSMLFCARYWLSRNCRGSA